MGNRSAQLSSRTNKKLTFTFNKAKWRLVATKATQAFAWHTFTITYFSPFKVTAIILNQSKGCEISRQKEHVCSRTPAVYSRTHLYFLDSAMAPKATIPERLYDSLNLNSRRSRLIKQSLEEGLFLVDSVSGCRLWNALIMILRCRPPELRSVFPSLPERWVK